MGFSRVTQLTIKPNNNETLRQQKPQQYHNQAKQ